MEFILYLDPLSLLLYYLASSKVEILENSRICSDKEIYGWFESQAKALTICTNNIKNTQPLFFGQYVRETLLHESVHVVQSCKSSHGELIKIGIDTTSLARHKIEDINRSIGISSKKYLAVEREAYYLEDKPLQLLWKMKKYCF